MIINPLFCFAFQVDIPTLVTENVAIEGLKHLEMYLSIKEKGIYINCLLEMFAADTVFDDKKKKGLNYNYDKIIDFWVFVSETDIFMTK